jgi:hypothetical protein
MSSFAPCHTEPKPTPHGLAALHWCNSIDLLGVALTDGTVTAYRWNEMDGSKKDWKRMWTNAADSAPSPSGTNADAAVAGRRLLLWQPDGRAAAVVSSVSIEVLNVESGAEIFHAALAHEPVAAQRVIDGVWVQLSAAAGGSSGADEKELNFTDFLPAIPRFTEGGGSANGDENDDDVDVVAGDLAPSASSSSTSPKPSLSLIAVVDARGRIR